MKKTILNSLLLGSLLLFSVSCSDFGDINIDPNNSTSVAPSTILTASLRTISSVVGATTGELYSQHMSQTQYTDGSRYATVNFDFNGWYTGALANLQHIIDLNTDEATKTDALNSGSNANQIAVARIMKAYFYHHMTDRWGPLPYTQALQGRENFNPPYDSQETIYKSLLSELKAAVGQIDGGAGVSGDLLFGGDMDAWKRFANTIRMTIALRMSEVDENLAKSEFVSAVSDGVITSNSENAMYNYLAESANQNPWYARFITRTDWAISSTLVDYMKPLGDPRLDAYADPSENHGDVRGMPYGIAAAGDIPNAEISFPGDPAVRAQDAPIAVYTASQVMFSMAEAALRGWTSGDAESLYNDAIKASWEQWGVFDQAAYDAFIAQDGVKFDASKGMEQIMTQKWVALYLQGYEAWNEWKRTGIPNLQPAPDALNTSGQIPVRQAYPTSERDLNEEAYNAGVGLLGGEDGLDTKLWWDK